MKLLLIDNYDSFTFNLFQQLSEICGQEPTVVKNDELSWSEINDLDFEAIVISPGPGRPDKASDFRICKEILGKAKVPILGVCLGHQGLGWLYGGKIELAPEAFHGRTSTIRHQGHFLFEGVPKEFQAVRYHSLCVNKNLPDQLSPIAWTDDGILMGLAHRFLPHFGIQFHPESVLTLDGPRILKNFVDYCRRFSKDRATKASLKAQSEVRPEQSGRSWNLSYKVMNLEHSAEDLFSHFFLKSSHSFWLDSSLIRSGYSRFSYMGDSNGPYSEVFFQEEGVFEDLNHRLLADRLDHCRDLPFDFQGGLVGYLSYEANHSKPQLMDQALSAWIFADRFFAIDHQEQKLYLVQISPEELDSSWFNQIQSSLPRVKKLSEPKALTEPALIEARHSKSEALDQIRQCQEWITIGESYELCLTNQFRVQSEALPWDSYRRLRSLNASPFAAFLNFENFQILSASPERFLKIDSTKMAEAKPIKGTCSRGGSPKEDRIAKSALKESIKDQSENLMIVDLLRNDLGTVSEIGSVRVPKLMGIESYATVHQMVSTITSKIKEEYTTVDAIKSCFPGGSMTGAPKKRSIKLLEKLEEGPRGIYSGALGFISLTGATDLSIVIRTLIHQEGQYSLGAGGAIVALSDAEAEVEEMLLKAKSSLRAVIPAEKIKFD